MVGYGAFYQEVYLAWVGKSQRILLSDRCAVACLK